MERIACNLCGSSEHKLLFQHRDTVLRVSDQVFDIVQCSSCGLVFVNPRPTEEEIGRFYVDQYYHTHLTAEEELCIRERQIRAKMDKIKHLKQGRALDIGCMKGEFLLELKKQGWEVEGLEISRIPENIFGLNIRYGENFHEADLQESHYDLVTMWAVLEHVHDPMAFFRKINLLLKPEGHFVFLVTNFDSPQGKWMQLDDYPRHLTVFTRDTVNKYLIETGFEMERFYCESKIFRTSCEGLFFFLWRRLFSGENFNGMAVKFRENSLKFVGLEGPQTSLIKRIKYKADSMACKYLVEWIINRINKGHIIIFDAKKTEREKKI